MIVHHPNAALVRGAPSGLPLCHRAWGRHPVPCYVHAPTAGAQSAPLPRRCFCTGSPPGSRFAIVRGAANPSLATSTHPLRERRALPYPDAAFVRGAPSGLPPCLPRRRFGRGALRAPALPSRVGPPTRPLLPPRTDCGSAERYQKRARRVPVLVCWEVAKQKPLALGCPARKESRKRRISLCSKIASISWAFSELMPRAELLGTAFLSPSFRSPPSGPGKTAGALASPGPTGIGWSVSR